MSNPPTPAGWHPDPRDASRLRYWDGQQWTEHMAPSPQQQPPPPPMPMYPQPRRGMSGGAIALLVVGIVLAVGLIGCVGAVVLVGTAADEADERLAEEDAREAEDVAIGDCTTDAAGMVARLDVTNNSSKRSNYSIEVSFESPDGGTQLATGWAYVDSVEPGQRATGDAHSLTDTSDDFECRVVSVERTSDEG